MKNTMILLSLWIGAFAYAAPGTRAQSQITTRTLTCNSAATGANITVTMDEHSHSYTMNEALADSLSHQGSTYVAMTGTGNALWNPRDFYYNSGVPHGYNLDLRADSGGMKLEYLAYVDSQAHKEKTNFFFQPGECRFSQTDY